MGNKKATERLERAEKVAREVWRKAGVEKPNDAQLAVGILVALVEEEREVTDE